MTREDVNVIFVTVLFRTLEKIFLSKVGGSFERIVFQEKVITIDIWEHIFWLRLFGLSFKALWDSELKGRGNLGKRGLVLDWEQDVLGWGDRLTQLLWHIWEWKMGLSSWHHEAGSRVVNIFDLSFLVNFKLITTVLEIVANLGWRCLLHGCDGRVTDSHL